MFKKKDKHSSLSLYRSLKRNLIFRLVNWKKNLEWRKTANDGVLKGKCNNEKLRKILLIRKDKIPMRNIYIYIFFCHHISSTKKLDFAKVGDGKKILTKPNIV